MRWRCDEIGEINPIMPDDRRTPTDVELHELETFAQIESGNPVLNRSIACGAIPAAARAAEWVARAIGAHRRNLNPRRQELKSAAAGT
jgi:hypothetical protein